MIRLERIEFRDMQSLLRSSEQTLQRARIIVNEAVQKQKFTAVQRAKLTGLIKKSRTLHRKAANAWLWLFSKDGLLREEYLNARTREGAKKATDMLVTVMENHQNELRKKLQAAKFKGKSLMAHLNADRHFKLEQPLAQAKPSKDELALAA